MLMSKSSENGLLIDYEYCTGCFACTVACCQEHGWDAPLSGMKVMEIVQDMPNDKAYLTFLPFPTELCVLCKPRTREGLDPSCVKHCMANCLSFGKLRDLALELEKKPRMVLWSPR
jgi:Fe-S-cluster-containing dehydrogenase component